MYQDVGDLLSSLLLQVLSSLLHSAVEEMLMLSAQQTAAKKLNKLIRKADSVLGCSLDGFEVVVERRSLNKLTAILDNTSHPLHDLLVRQQSSFSIRLIQICCSEEWYRRSFVPTAIALYNTSPLCRDITVY